MYLLDLKVEQPVCLAARHTEEPWLWHARFGHLSSDALGRLEKMVRGLPHIEHRGELCDSCLAGKQRRLPFPKAAKYRAANALELVHGDLCGPITPSTNGGRRYFLLLVDDCSRYMRVDKRCSAVHRRVSHDGTFVVEVSEIRSEMVIQAPRHKI